MPNYSIEDVAMIADNEGLSYMLQHFLDPNDIVDPDLRVLCNVARDMLNRIDAILAPHYG